MTVEALIEELKKMPQDVEAVKFSIECDEDYSYNRTDPIHGVRYDEDDKQVCL